jgi:chromosome segregation ATPase
MTSSPVQAQRGTDERERLLRELEHQADPNCPDVLDVPDAIALRDMLRADAETIRLLESQKATWTRVAKDLGNQAEALQEQLDARSAEVEALRAALKEIMMSGTSAPVECGNQLESFYRGQLFSCIRTAADALNDAALEEKSRDAG